MTPRSMRTVAWREDSDFAEIDDEGALTTSMVASDQTIKITADYDDPDRLRETESANYKAIATFENGDKEELPVVWKTRWSKYAVVDDKGRLTAKVLQKRQKVALIAVYKGDEDIKLTVPNNVEIKVTLEQDIAGDFDGDRISDIFWRNPNSGENMLWRNSKTGIQLLWSMDGFERLVFKRPAFERPSPRRAAWLRRRQAPMSPSRRAGWPAYPRHG